MKATQGLVLVALAGLSLLLTGCSGNEKGPDRQKEGKPATGQSKEEKIKANLARLEEEDRKLAEAQKFCAVERDNLLGSMGKPFKLVLKGQSVFLCCKGCEAEAKENPDRTLARVKELRDKHGPAGK